ncbi:MAG: hypothetical protein RLZ44_1049 [Pseudomonadota bacterium]|jgi:hypothetical protein
MKVAKKTSEYTVYARNDGRYAVKGQDKQFVNGEDKVKILLAEGLIKKSEPNPNKPAEEAPAAEGDAAE